jgi:hypothetical protein
MADEADYQMGLGVYSLNRHKRHYIQQDFLFYYTEYTFQEIVQETNKAYLFLIDDTQYWVAKSLVKELDIHKKTCSIHSKTMNSILGTTYNNVVIEFT